MNLQAMRFAVLFAAALVPAFANAHTLEQLDLDSPEGLEHIVQLFEQVVDEVTENKEMDEESAGTAAFLVQEALKEQDLVMETIKDMPSEVAPVALSVARTFCRWFCQKECSQQAVLKPLALACKC